MTVTAPNKTAAKAPRLAALASGDREALAGQRMLVQQGHMVETSEEQLATMQEIQLELREMRVEAPAQAARERIACQSRCRRRARSV